MTNPRVASLKAANKTTRELARLFGKLGDRRHPRGRILVSYRNVQRSLRDILRRETGALAALEAQEVLQELRWSVQAVATETLNAAGALGQRQAATEYEAWDLSGPLGVYVGIDAFLDSWLGLVDQQIRETLAIIAVEGDTALVLGDDTRQGLLRSDAVINSGTRWLTAAAVLTFANWLLEPIQATGEIWGKQAIPTIDLRTTNCCLEVAGQVVPFDGKFKLTGTPRFADEMEWSPFHWYCRTSIAMVPMWMADDNLTQRILSDSRAELGAREEAREQAMEIQQELAALGAQPDGRRRVGDSEEVAELRNEYAKLVKRGGNPSGS